MTDQIGHCKHGEFILFDGCPQCIQEVQANKASRHIVKVRYGADATEGREYSYYTEEALTVGDLVEVPTKSGSTKARVTAIEIPEEAVARFKDAMRTIPAGSKYPGEKATAPEQLKPEQEELEEGLNSEGLTLVGAKEAPSETAVIQIAPDHDAAVKLIIQEAQVALAYAEALVIKTPVDNEKAHNDLALIGKRKKSLMEKQAEYTKPLNAYKDSIITTFREMLAPILKADEITRSKMMAYTREQESLRMKQEKINQLKMEAAQKEMELNGELSESVNLVEVVPAAPTTVRTGAGTSGMTDHWKYEVFDFALLDDAYKVEDSSQLSAIARKHHDKKQVAGVKFYNEPSITMRAR